MSKTAIVIINWNGAQDTIECIKSLESNEKNIFSVFVLDNGSEIESSNYLENWIYQSNYADKSFYDLGEFEQISHFPQLGINFIKSDENLGFAKGNNVILRKIYNFFDYCILLNNDTVVEKYALSNMVQVFDTKPELKVATCNIRYYFNPDKLWNAGGRFTFYGDRKYFSNEEIKQSIVDGKTIISSPFVTGCVLMIRRTVFDEVGFLSEKFFFGEEDFNYCKRLKIKNIKPVSVLNSLVYHKISSSITKAASGETLLRKAILHFTNRTIDQKIFMGKSRWGIWRIGYLFAVWVNIFRQTSDRKKAWYVCKNVWHYSSLHDDVDYELFKEINRLSLEKAGVS